MDKNPFLKRLMKAKKEDVIHSSAYASAQNRGIGASSTESFAQRRQIDQNRTTVRSYGDSKIASEARNNHPKAKTYTASEDKPSGTNQSAESSTKSTPSDRFAWTPSPSKPSSPAPASPATPVQPPARRNPGISR